MEWGQQIGHKFNTLGEPMPYPGNTVISDLTAENPAWHVIDQARGLLQRSVLNSHFILLPQDSYHMTIIRGLNDLVRTDGYWPNALSKDVSMQVADEYVARAVASVPCIGSIHLRFDQVLFDDADVRIRMLPADQIQQNRLTDYRDQVAEAIGLRLPGHQSYGFHLTLAYMLHKIPQAQQASLRQLKADIDQILISRSNVQLDPPYFAYYQNMFHFSPTPLSRDAERPADAKI